MQSGNLSSIRRRKSRRVLAVKMLAAKTAWLDARLRWRDGKVVWDRPGGPLVPRPADLAAARRALDEIARYRDAAGRALGDAQGLVERRRRRLEIAKLLCEIHEPDLSALAREARAGSRRAMNRLLGTLVAGALCAEPLPVEPSRVIVACTSGAEPLLRRLLDDEEAPREGRALAAMTLGALHQASAPIPLTRDPWIRRAYGWGRRAGLPADPTMVLTLLAESNGEDLARRLLAAQSMESRFQLPAALLRDLLADGVAAERMIEIVEACAEAAPIAARLLEYRCDLPMPFSRERRKATAERLAAEREEALAGLVTGVHDYLRSMPDAAVIRAVATLAKSLRRHMGFPREIARALTAVLRAGSNLPPELRIPFLNLLVEHQNRVWEIPTLPDIPDPSKHGRLNAWFEERHGKAVRPIQALLRSTCDARFVGEMVDRGLAALLCSFEWSELERHRLVVRLGLACDLPSKSYLWKSLCKVVGSYKTTAAARAAIAPVVSALAKADSETRQYLMGHILRMARRRRRRDLVLPAFARFADRLLRFVAEHEYTYRLGYCLDALVKVEETAPHMSDATLEHLLAHVATLKETGDVAEELFVPATTLGLLLADGDLARCKAVVDTILRSTPPVQRGWFADGVGVLDRHPAIRAACVASFGKQPRRCISLLARLGQALELGAAALEPLAALRPLVGADARDSRDGTYVRARLLLGEDEALPAGVRRALDLPRKLERELAHIEALLEREPEREDLAARAASLRNRLADEGRLRAEVEKGASERLERATAEALLLAAERQVLACFRKQLVSFVGAMPERLRFDDDLLNAIFMSVDLTTNRKHLVQLVREHAWGEGEWRSSIPANAEFLESLAARGVNTAIWLGAHPHSYGCEAAAGGRVRLAFECDPIRVLQMGTYFDTCLSAGECNSFSAVANACELNKRVVYATDGEGRIVGRKLVAIDETGRLLGFRTYVGLHDEAGNTALFAAFDDYVRAFAAACGLELADKGTVPKLFVEGWYDDGACAWAD